MMFAHAVDHDILATNPIAKVKLPKIEHEEMRFLTPAEIDALADAIDPRYRALVYVGAYGGLRIGELGGLQIGDLEILGDKGIISVQRQVVEVAGKLTTGPLKTKAARRKLQLPAPVVGELSRHLASPDHSGNLVFPSPSGGLLSRTRFRGRVWLPACAVAGLQGVRVHDLRHTAVSLWIATGASPKEVARRAGHTSVRTVFDVYGHLLPNAEDDLIAGLDRLMLGRGQAATVTPIATKSATRLVEQPAR